MSRPSLPPGSKFGRWTVVEDPTWTGCMSHVKPVQDDAGNNAVIKIRKSHSDYIRNRFKEEAQGGRRFTEEGQRGVLRVLDVDPDLQPRWMVTERAEPLDAHLSGGGWDFRSAVEAVSALAATVAELHGQVEPLAHRDLKPDNLFWTSADGPLVGDFGISTWAPQRNITALGGKLGPLFYMAPELEQYNKRLTPRELCRADVYSLGKVLWHLCAAGAHPPQGPLSVRDPEASLHEYGGQSSRVLRRVIDRATAHRPIERPVMADFARELEVWLDLFPIDHDDLAGRSNPRGIRGGPAWVSSDEQAWAHGEEKVLSNSLRHVARSIAGGFGEAATVITSDNHAEHGQDPPQVLQDAADLVLYPDWEPDAVAAVSVLAGGQTVALEAVLDGGVAHYLGEIQRAGQIVDGSVIRCSAVVGFPTDRAALEHLATRLAQLARPSSNAVDARCDSP